MVFDQMPSIFGFYFFRKKASVALLESECHFRSYRLGNDVRILTLFFRKREVCLERLRGTARKESPTA
jgi:hypothetical protein